jgi:hypothetical protein
MNKQRRPRLVWFGRLHADLPLNVHPVSWQGWLLTAVMIFAEMATVLVPGLTGTALWVARGAILALYMIIAWATRDPQRNV